MTDLQIATGYKAARPWIPSRSEIFPPVNAPAASSGSLRRRPLLVPRSWVLLTPPSSSDRPRTPSLQHLLAAPPPPHRWSLAHRAYGRQVCPFRGQQNRRVHGRVPSFDSWRGAGEQFLLCMRAQASDKHASGEQRTDATFRNWVKVGDAEFPPEAGRYHLYISHACPWANRCNTVRYMKGLTDVIGLSVVHPTWARSRPDDENDLHCGWQFKVGCPR